MNVAGTNSTKELSISSLT